MVGATGFEPATSRSQSERSTRLSHAPTPPHSRTQAGFAGGDIHSARLSLRSVSARNFYTAFVTYANDT